MPKSTDVRQWLRTHRGLVLLGALALLIDRATKVWALTVLVRGPIPLGKYFWLNYVENTGAAFGMFQNGNGLLIGVMLAILGYLVWSWKDLAKYGRMAEYGAILIIAGALGNLYDRITLGFVVDFLDFRVWPVFNVADACITVGAAVLGMAFLRAASSKQEEK